MTQAKAINRFILGTTFFAATFLGVNAESGIYDRIGIINEHGLHGAVPEENIDLFTGNLTLRNLDIHLPGPNGFDLKIWRVYNSKILKDRLMGSAWGIQQEPYSWVGIGWSMHMGRLHGFNSETPAIEYPDGRWETAYHDINDYAMFITRDFAKLDKSDWKLYFKDGTTWTFGALANIVSGSMSIEQVRVVTKITNSYGHQIDITYDASGSPRMKSIEDSMGRTVTFIIDSALGKLERVDVKNATGGTVSYYYTVGSFNGDFYKLTKFDPPILPAVTYEYGSGLQSNWELTAVNTSYGGRMEYDYVEHDFYYMVHVLQTKVIGRKRIRFSSNSELKTWIYSYPSYNNAATGTVEVDGPLFSTTATYHAYSSSAPWKIGLLKSKSSSDDSFSEQYTWIPQIISNTRWYVLNIDMGQATAPLQSTFARSRVGDADASEEYLYERAATKKYGLPTRINYSANGDLKKYSRLEYYFESVSSFATKYMLTHVQSETQYSSGGSKIKESSMAYFANGALDSVTKWRSGTTYLTWNYGYSSSNPNNITITIDQPGSGGIETMIYKFGVLATLRRPDYTEYVRTISAYDSSILSETNQHGGTMSFSYDALGRITKVGMPSGFSDITATWSTNYVTIIQGNAMIKKFWDGMGRDTGHVEEGDGISLYYRKTLDAEGRTVAESKGSTDIGVDYDYELNAAGMIKKITDPRGKITVITLVADQRTVRDPNNHATILEYGHLPGLVTRVTDPAGDVATFTYDGLGRMQSTIFNSSRNQSYTYNGFDQVTTETHPETGLIAYEYSPANNLATKTWAGASIAYTYNVSNQVLTENAGDEAVTYAYDARGRILSVSGGQGWSKTSIAYNTLGAITQQVHSIPGLGAKTVSYAHDGNNRVSLITYPDGNRVAYAHNGLNLPETVNFNGSTIVSAAAYGINKQPTAITIGANGTVYSASYNNNGGILTARLNKSAASLYDVSYGYDGVGNIIAISNATPSFAANYTYDARNRLTAASYSPSGVGRVNDFVYGYDAYGNITQAKENGVMAFYQTYNTKNQSADLSYDGRGNVISSALFNYAWDKRNRLGQVTSKLSGESESAFLYDEGGMRLKATRAIPPALEVTFPTADSEFCLGETQTITWTSQGGVSGPLRIVLRLPDEPLSDPVLVIADGTENDGAFDWTVPDTLPPGEYLIRVRTVSDSPFIYDDSEVFRVASCPGVLTVTAPASGAAWCLGENREITWKSRGAVTEPLRIVLRLPDEPLSNPVLLIADSTDDDGSFIWNIPDTLAAGSYLIRVRTVSDSPLIYGDSASFVIASCPGAITVAAPASGSGWNVGETHDISWTTSGTVSEPLRIVLRLPDEPNSDPVLIIADNTEDDGTYSWTIPDSVTPGNYLVRVRTVSNSPFVYGDSGTFHIGLNSALKLTSPQGGENWRAGGNEPITWTGGGEIRELKIEYSIDQGSTYRLVAEHVSNAGSYSWRVPGTVSDHCLVRISDAQGQPVLENGVLEYEMAFAVQGKAMNAEQRWFSLCLDRLPTNDQDNLSTALSLALGRTGSSSGCQLEFGENVTDLADHLSLFDKTHAIKLQWDIMNGRGTVYFDQQAVMQDVPLLPVTDPAFAPGLILNTGGGVDALRLDNIRIALVDRQETFLDGSNIPVTGAEALADAVPEGRTIFFDDFESYKPDEPLARGGWSAAFASPGLADAARDGLSSRRERKGAPGLDTRAPISDLHSGFVSIPDHATLILSKPISWPERRPFAVSAKPFAIVQQTESETNNEQDPRVLPEGDFQDKIIDGESADLELRGPHSGMPATVPPGRATLYATTYYIHSFDGKLLAEYDATGTCVKDYIYMGKRLIAEYQTATGKYYYYTPDQINSTRIITDSSGTVVYSAVFDPFGGMQKQWVNTYSPSLKFSGKEREARSELDYFGARYYDHTKYRFLSVDPMINKEEALINPQLWNLYSYCRNNPVTYFDPNGGSSFKCNANIAFVPLYGPDLHGYGTGVTKPASEDPTKCLTVNSIINKNDKDGTYSLSIEASLDMRVAVLDPSGWNSSLDTFLYSIFGWDTTNTLRHELNHVSDVENIVKRGLDKMEGINFSSKADVLKYRNNLFKNVVDLVGNATKKSSFWRDSPVSPINWKENIDVMQGK